MEKNYGSLHGKLIPALRGDLFVRGIPKSNPLTHGESGGDIAAYTLGYLQEFVARVHEVCVDKEQSEQQKREACEKLFSLCRDASLMLLNLARAFPELFKSIAQERANFPCLFPVHPEEQEFLKEFVLQRLELGSKHELKLRPPRGRKTFSFEGMNGLLLLYIEKIRSIQHRMLFLQLSNPWSLAEDRQPSPIERLDEEFPLCSKFAKQWMDVIWELLLQDFPHPETHSYLKRLGSRHSRTGRAGSRKKASWRDIRGAMAKDNQPDASGYIRNAIKGALQRYLIRMLRKLPDR